AAELRAFGIGVTVLCPTFFRTNIARSGRTRGDDVSPDFVEKLMDKATVQAPDVARAALDAADAGKLYCVPHADGRWAWRLKGAVPAPLYGNVGPALITR